MEEGAPSDGTLLFIEYGSHNEYNPCAEPSFDARRARRRLRLEFYAVLPKATVQGDAMVTALWMWKRGAQLTRADFETGLPVDRDRACELDAGRRIERHCKSEASLWTI
jgi:hypothetical protein